MIEQIELLQQLTDASVRRCWLLAKALECVPLDRAIELARAAEAFLNGSTPESPSVGAPEEEPPADRLPIGDEQSRDPAEPPARVHSVLQKRTSLTLPAERREELLNRLAAGATNAEVAAEFGLSAQQVQGIRIGSSREIAKRREVPKEPDRQANGGSLAKTTDQIYRYLRQKDEIVRYLQQQDDVVVRQADGLFLVNGRFRMSLADLAERANRMRRRQGKPEFETNGTEQQPPHPQHPAGRDGHRAVSDATAEDKVSH
jgi:hypothetical protein